MEFSPPDPALFDHDLASPIENFVVPLAQNSLLSIYGLQSPREGERRFLSLCLDDLGTVIGRAGHFSESPPDNQIFSTAVGGNFLSACTRVAPQSASGVIQTAEAIRSILLEQLPEFEAVYPINHHDQQRWFRNRVLPLKLARRMGCLVTHEEVTTSVFNARSHRRRRQDDQYFRLIAEGSSKANFVLDATNKIQWVNPAFTRLFGYEQNELRGKDIGSILRLMECGTQYLQRFADSLANRSDFVGELYAYDRNGRGMWLSLELRFASSEDFSSPRLIGCCVDITDLRQRGDELKQAVDRAEEMTQKLRENQQVLDFALAGADLAFWNWSLQSGEMTFNDRWATTLGYQLSELPQHFSTFQGLLHPSDKLRTEQAISRCLNYPTPEQDISTSNIQLDIDYRLRTRAGVYLWMRARGRVVQRFSDGSPKLMCGVQYSIEERKNSELKIEGLVRLIDESSNEVYVFDSTDLKFISVNRGARENLGYSEEELSALTPLDLMLDLNRQRFQSLAKQLQTNLKQRLQFETSHKRKDGSCYPVHVFLQKTKLVNREVYAAFVLDLSHRKQLEKQLAQAQKLESLGRLAAGISHEINTPIHYVNENLGYLRDQWERVERVLMSIDDQTLSYLLQQNSVTEKSESELTLEKLQHLCRDVPGSIRDSLCGLSRVIEITQAMKQMAHPGKIEKTLTDINQLIRDTITVTKKKWNANCLLDLSLDKDLPAIPVLPSELGQAILNLLINAIDAIDDRYAGENSGPGRIGIRTWEEQDAIVFEIEDNGAGIPSEIAERVFEPFFTTKDRGNGSGQGLTICHNIVVEKHQGTIAVDSRKNEGTRFIVRIPKSAAVPLLN